MKRLSLVALLFSVSALAGPAVIWYGNTAKVLPSGGLTFSGTDEKNFFDLGVADPTVTGKAAPVGSLGLSNVLGAGKMFIKLGAADNAWGLPPASLAPLGANHVVVADGSGNLSSEAKLSLSRMAEGTTGYPLLGAGAGSSPSYGQISNSGISNTAAIALSKLAALTGNRVPVTNGTGEIIASSVSDTSLSYLDASSSIQTQLNGKQASGNYITALTGDVTASGPGSVAGTVASVGGSSAANVHAAELLANAATDANTASAIVKRDASGNFTAGMVSANLTGTVTGNASTASALASNPSDCAANQFASSIDASGNLSCSSIPNSATTGTDANTASAIVARDASGNFSAGTISAALSGNASTATALAANPSDCAANNFATTIDASGNLTCSTIPNSATTATDSNTASAIVARDASGNFSAGTITANLTGNASGTAANVTGTVAIANGGTGQTTKAPAFDALSPTTTKGDTIAHDGTNNVRVPVGTDGQVWTADSSAAAGAKWSASTGGTGFKNFVPNPSAAISASTGWTYVNLTGTRDTDAGDKIDGVASFALSGATHPATMTTDALTLDDNTTGNCEFGIFYKGDATKWQIELLNGSDVAVSTITNLTNETAWTEAYQVYPCATGYKLRLASNAASPATPNVGGYFWGKARHLGVVNPTGEWVSYSCSLTTTGGGAITLNATSKTDMNCKYRDNGDSIDIQATFRNGSGGAASGAAGAVQVPIPTGKTPDTSKMPTAVGGIRADGFARFGTTFFGTNNVYLNGSYFLFERGDTGANLSVSDLASGFYFGMQARIPVLENRSKTIVTADKQVDRTGEVFAVAGACPANTIPADGKIIGKASGDYQGGAYYALYAKLWALPGLSTTAGHPFKISSAAGASALADWDAGKTITVDFATNELFIRQDGSNTTLGAYQASQDKNVISFNYAAPSAGGFGVGTDVNSEARPNNVALTYCINPQPSQPQPILSGGVTSTSTVHERLERIQAENSTCSSGTCAVGSKTPGITSITHGASTGTYVINFAAGTFSSAPTCIYNSISRGTSNSCSGNGPSCTASTCNILCTNATGSPVDDNPSAICMGPR